MSVEPKRSILSELKKPLIQSSKGIPPGLEERLLGLGSDPQPSVESPPSNVEPSWTGDPLSRVEQPRRKTRPPTIPVTFHLPIELRDRIKLTAQAKGKTMLEVAVEALGEYLERNPVSEADVRRLLGL